MATVTWILIALGMRHPLVQSDEFYNTTDDIIFDHPLRPYPSPFACDVSSLGEVDCPVCEAPVRACRERVRQSWSSLTVDEKKRVIAAMRVMKSTSAEEGKQQYGEAFKNYDEFIVMHAASEQDSRGDQAHLDQHFVVWHSVFVLLFENSLLAIDPEIGGMPYWDIRDGLDTLFGNCSDVCLGTVRGTGPYYQVQDGAFSDWTVSSYNESLIAGSTSLPSNFSDVFDSDGTGTKLIRTSAVPTNQIVRYPACPVPVGPFAFSQDDYVACVSQSTFEEFYWCLESPVVNGAHELTHFWIGSADDDANQYGFGCPLFSPPNLLLDQVRQGDYIDKATSPNDPIFMFHHSFVDMMSMEFMRRNADIASTYYEFKAYDEEGTEPHVDNSFLLDVVGIEGWPFVGADVLNDDDAPQGSLAHWEVLCWVGPDTAIYTYDIFLGEDADGDIADDVPICEEDADGDSAAVKVATSLLGLATTVMAITST